MKYRPPLEPDWTAPSPAATPPRPPPPSIPRTRWPETCSRLPDSQGEVPGHRLMSSSTWWSPSRRRGLTAKTRAATAWFRACRWIHEHRWSATFGVLMVTGSGVRAARGDWPAVAARRAARCAATGRRWPPNALHAARGLPLEISSFQIRTGCSDAKYSSFACYPSHCVVKRPAVSPLMRCLRTPVRQYSIAASCGHTPV